MDKDQPFANLEDDIVYFKSKGEVIVFGDMNARTRTFQLDAQLSFIPHISRMQEGIQIISRSFSNEKIQTNLGSYSYKCAIVPNCLLQMVFSYGPTHMVLHVETTMEIV